MSVPRRPGTSWRASTTSRPSEPPAGFASACGSCGMGEPRHDRPGGARLRPHARGARAAPLRLRTGRRCAPRGVDRHAALQPGPRARGDGRERLPPVVPAVGVDHRRRRLHQPRVARSHRGTAGSRPAGARAPPPGEPRPQRRPQHGGERGAGRLRPAARRRRPPRADGRGEVPVVPRVPSGIRVRQGLLRRLRGGPLPLAAGLPRGRRVPAREPRRAGGHDPPRRLPGHRRPRRAHQGRPRGLGLLAAGGRPRPLGRDRPRIPELVSAAPWTPPRLVQPRRSAAAARLPPGPASEVPRLWRSGLPRPAGAGATLRDELPWTNRLRKTKPRLLVLVPWLTAGGADKFNLDLVTELAGRGWEVTVAATQDGDQSWLAAFASQTPDVFVLPHFLRPADYPRFLRYLTVSRGVDAVVLSHS